MELNQQQIVQMRERLYFVRWTFSNDLTNKPDEQRLETFEWDERQKALSRYLDLKDKYYAQNVKFQVAQPQDVNIADFINSF